METERRIGALEESLEYFNLNRQNEMTAYLVHN